MGEQNALLHGNALSGDAAKVLQQYVNRYGLQGGRTEDNRAPHWFQSWYKNQSSNPTLGRYGIDPRNRTPVGFSYENLVAGAPGSSPYQYTYSEWDRIHPNWRAEYAAQQAAQGQSYGQATPGNPYHT